MTFTLGYRRMIGGCCLSIPAWGGVRKCSTNLFWTGIIYFVGLFLLGVIWWKALIVGIVAAICWYLNYGRRSVFALGMVALCLG